MPTTRHHINRERRRQSRDTRTRPAASPEQQRKQPEQEKQPEQQPEQQREQREQPEQREPGLSEQREQPEQPGQPGRSEPTAHRTRSLVMAVRPRSARTAVGAPDAARDRRTGGATAAAQAARDRRTAGATPTAQAAGDRRTGGATAAAEAAGDRQADGTTPATGKATPARPRSRPRTALALLCALTLLLGGFAGWAHARAGALRDDPALRNTALTDLARTSEIKGQTAKAVGRLFSYDHTDPGALQKAAEGLLTGKAVAQHRALLADVRKRADAQKAVITTTVTDSAVERIDGDRARVLVYADQSSVSTSGTRGKQDEGVYAGAMLAVDVVLRDGRWLISGIDTFGR